MDDKEPDLRSIISFDRRKASKLYETTYQLVPFLGFVDGREFEGIINTWRLF